MRYLFIRERGRVIDFLIICVMMRYLFIRERECVTMRYLFIRKDVKLWIA